MDVVKGFSWVVRNEYGDKEKSFRDFDTFHSASDGITESLSDFLLRCKRYLTVPERCCSRYGDSNIKCPAGVLPTLMLLWVQHFL